MIRKFVEYLESHVGDAYVWGAQGECLTTMDNWKSWIEKKETSATNANRAIAFVNKAKKTPLYAFDCSGLGVRFLLDNKLIKSDISSRGMYSSCKKIERSELRVGDFVFRHNGSRIHHVGYVVKILAGRPQIIEAMGRDAGVVCRDIDASGKTYWNRYGRFEALSNAKVQTDTSGNTIVIEKPVEVGNCYFAECSGSQVNVRSGRSTSYSSYGKLPLGAKMLALPERDGWCEIACYLNGKLITGYMYAAYVKKA